MKTSYFLMPAFSILFFMTAFSLKDVSPTNYEKEKQVILLEKAKFKRQYDSVATTAGKSKVVDKAGVFLEKKIMESIIPAWYGTPWDFNGYTAIPKEGKIACGYFVSTVLKHAGFNLNRYKLAQQHALDEVKTLSKGEEIHRFLNTNRDDFLKKAKNSLKNGLFVIGLDYHVGFLLKHDDQIWFIHSNYRGPVAVQKEVASESEALNDSKVFILTAITTNKSLIKAWIMGEQINH